MAILVDSSKYLTKYQQPAVPVQPARVHEHVIQAGLKAGSMAKVIQDPLRIAEKGRELLAVIPTFAGPLAPYKDLLRRPKEVIYFLHGFKTMDWMASGKRTFQFIVLHTAGLALFIFSTIQLAERYAGADFTKAKNVFSKIPVTGALAWGGTFVVALVTLLSSIFYMQKKERDKQISKQENCEEKIRIWRQMSIDDIRQRKEKYDRVITDLEGQIAPELNYQELENNRFYRVCNIMRTKRNDWQTVLDRPETLEAFKNKKLNKWEKKKEKLGYDIKAKGIALGARASEIGSLVITAVGTLIGVGTGTFVLGMAAVELTLLISTRVYERKANKVEVPVTYRPDNVFV